MKTLIEGYQVWIPSREELEDLQVGDFALDCFGRWNKITEIFAKGEDIHGKFFVCYYVKFSSDGSSTISGSAKEGEPTPTVPLLSRFCRMQNIPLGVTK